MNDSDTPYDSIDENQIEQMERLREKVEDIGRVRSVVEVDRDCDHALTVIHDGALEDLNDRLGRDVYWDVEAHEHRKIGKQEHVDIFEFRFEPEGPNRFFNLPDDGVDGDEEKESDSLDEVVYE